MSATLSRYVRMSLALLLTPLWVTAGQLETSYGYDEAGNKTSQTDALGRTTRWTYSLTNRVTSRTLPDGKSESFSYDAVGNLMSYTDFSGQRTFYYGYDKSNRQNLIKYPDGRTISITYTPNGKRATITETVLQNSKRVSRLTRYSYDSNDRLLKIESSDGSFINYSYDTMSNIAGRSTVNGTTVYEYDEVNHLVKVTDSKGGVTKYTYDTSGRLMGSIYPNGTDSLNEYDENGNLLQVAWRKTATGKVITATRYTLLPNGLRATVTRFDEQSTLQVSNLVDANGKNQEHWELGNPSIKIDYTYDGLSRLGSEHQYSYRDVSPYQELTSRWVYDSTGNRIYQERKVLSWTGEINIETTNYNYDSRDRLLSDTTVTATGSTISNTYSWDDNGRLIRKAANSEVTLYDWSDDDRLKAVRRGASDTAAKVIASYDYNPDGLRIRRTTGNGTVTEYIVDQSFLYAQTLEEKVSRASGEVSSTRYEWGNSLIASLPLSGSISSDSVESKYFYTDGLGSITATAGLNAIKYLGFEAFGKSQNIISQGSGFSYASEYYDADIGLFYNRMRWYDPAVGRFISSDKFKGDIKEPMTLNKYIYAGSSPVNFKDPSGAFTVGQLAAATGILTVLGGISLGIQHHQSDVVECRVSELKEVEDEEVEGRGSVKFCYYKCLLPSGKYEDLIRGEGIIVGQGYDFKPIYLCRGVTPIHINHRIGTGEYKESIDPGPVNDFVLRPFSHVDSMRYDEELISHLRSKILGE